MESRSIETSIKQQPIPGKRKVTFFILLGIVAFGFAVWRSSWIAFAVGATCWLMGLFIACIAIVVFASETVKKEGQNDPKINN